MSNDEKRVYVASSWRNGRYEQVTDAIRSVGFKVLDWRMNGGGHHVNAVQEWVKIRSQDKWAPGNITEALEHPGISDTLDRDKKMIEDADILILLRPCGMDAHFEAGLAVGMGKIVYILLVDGEECCATYRWSGGVFGSIDELVSQLENLK